MVVTDVRARAREPLSRSAHRPQGVESLRIGAASQAGRAAVAVMAILGVAPAVAAHVVDRDGAKLEFALPPGDAIDVRLAQMEGAVDVRIAGGDLAEPLTIRTEAGRRGQLRAVLIGGVSGRIELDIRARRRSARFELEATPSRAATRADRVRAAAFRDYATAESLRRQNYRETAIVARAAGTDEQTRAAYLRARAAYAEAADECGVRLTAIGEARMEVSIGNYEQARTLIGAALEARCTDDPAEHAQALKTLGMAAAYQGDYARSAEAAEAALALYRQTNDVLYQGVVLGNLSSVYSELGDTSRALEAARGAFDAAVASDDAQGIPYSRKSIAAIQLARGELAAALATYRQTLVDLEETPYPLVEGETWNDLGILYHRMAQYEDSARAYARAQAVWSKMKYATGIVDTTLNEAEALLDRGATKAAERAYRHALQIAEADGLKAGQIRALRGIGAVHLAGRDWPIARRELRRSRELARAIGARAAESYAVRLLGDLELAQSGLLGARLNYEQALRLVREAGDRDGEAVTLGRLARVQWQSGELTAARAQIEEALAIVESQRRQIADPSLRTSYYAESRALHDARIGILMALDRMEPGRGHDVAAFEAAEAARARELQDSIAERAIDVRRDVDPALLAAERAAGEALRVSALRLSRLPPEAPATRRAEAQAAVDAARRTLDEARGRVRSAHPRYAELLLPRPAELAELQRELLDRDSAILAYWLGERESWLWVLTSERLRTVRLAARRSLERSAEALRTALTAGAMADPGPTATLESLAERDAASRRRLESLIAEANAQLLGAALEGLPARRIAVIADGALQRVPFALLGVPSARAGSLAARELVHLPSLTTLRALRRAPTRDAREARIAVLADPLVAITTGLSRTRALDGSDRFDLRRLAPLPSARAEARTIAALLPPGRSWIALGHEATRQAVLERDWSRDSIVHFAAHSLVDLQRPELSGIVLSLYDRDGRPVDGFLRINDIYNLEMPANLIVLSACESAIGRSYGGEGAFSLARAFFYAGAPRVLASLWPIEDRATARFMASFYRALLKEGRPAAAALRAAQRELAREPRWSAPYYWAGFVLQGDWR